MRRKPPSYFRFNSLLRITNNPTVDKVQFAPVLANKPRLFAPKHVYFSTCNLTVPFILSLPLPGNPRYCIGQLRRENPVQTPCKKESRHTLILKTMQTETKKMTLAELQAKTGKAAVNVEAIKGGLMADCHTGVNP